MITKSYNQLCGLALALDVVGERWTVLIIRELIAGPRRFTDLMEGLSGISTNLLTRRLKGLEGHGVIRRRTLPPPAASTVYELTKLGRDLEETMLALGKWGSQFVAVAPEEAEIMHFGSYALTPKTFFRPERAGDLDATYALYIGDEIQGARIANGSYEIQPGEPEHADVSLHAPVAIYLGMLQRVIDIDAALADGLIRVEGDVEKLRRFVDACYVAYEE